MVVKQNKQQLEEYDVKDYYSVVCQYTFYKLVYPFAYP